MIRGTTPRVSLRLPFAASDVTLLDVAFVQDTTIVIEKHLSDAAQEGNKIVVPLSEADTLALDASKLCKIQFRVGCGTQRLATKIFTVSVGALLKDGALS